MENLVRGEPTFSTISPMSPMLVGHTGHQEAPQNFTKIVENVTTVDMSGVEDAIKDLIKVIQSMPKPVTTVEAPHVSIEAPRAIVPTVMVEAPAVTVEPKIEIAVSTHWIFFASLIPTLAFLADIYVRVVFK